MKFALLALLVAGTATTAAAYDFASGGIYYQITGSSTVSVTYYSSSYNSYSGTVTIPSSVTYNGKTYQVTEVGQNAFAYSTGLTAVTIPNSVTTLGRQAFGITGLKSITIPNSVTNVDANVFYNCSSLQSVTIGTGIKTLTNYMFFGCKKLTKVEIPNTVTEIGNATFKGCDVLSSVTLGSGLTKLGSTVFANCPSLSNVTCLASTPPTMSSSDCFDASTYSSATLSVPGGSLNAYKSADWWRMFSTINALSFDFCVDGIYYKKTSNNTVEVTYKDILNNVYTGNVTIPSSIKVNNVTYNVTAIGTYAFYMCTNLTSVSLPNTITIIDGCAFEKCSKLTSFTIPNSVTTLGVDAFSSCTSLHSIDIPNSVTKIDMMAFSNCTAMTTVTIGSGVTSIAEKAFSECSALTSISCLAATPPTMKNSNCFDASTYSSATLRVPGGSLNAYKSTDWWRMFNTIDALPFDFYVNGIYYKKTSNNTVEVTYKDILVANYSGSVTIPSTIKVNNVTYKVTAIGDAAFYMCTGLTNVSMPNTITSINAMAFEKCSGLKNVIIPNSVTTLGIDAFSSCTGLTMVVIPNSVITIDDLAFYNCTAMTTATIGSGVTSLGDEAFYGCTALNTIICSAKTPPTMKTNNCFSSSTYNSATLYVPRNSLNAYKTADWWRMFVTIFGTDSGTDPCDVNGDGEVNIADINALINAILTNNDDPVYDANDDGEINIADINFVIKAILNS